MLLGITIDVRLLQCAKAFIPMSVTFGGMVTEVRFLQPETIPPRIFVKPAGSVIDVRPEPLKAPSPITVTLSGIVMDVSDVQPANI